MLESVPNAEVLENWVLDDFMSMARATKAKLELRVGEAVSMLVQGNGATVVTAHVAETYRLRCREARRITPYPMREKSLHHRAKVVFLLLMASSHLQFLLQE